jgi:N-acetyl-gamma-glutamylphosphate reductase
MAMIATDDHEPVPCAAVFTQNKFAAPPVELDRATLQANGGKAAAVIVNSGNANAGTGAAGYKNAQLMAAATGEALHAAYDCDPFVHGIVEPPATKWVSGSNGVQLTARYDERTNRVLAISAIDNLGKGAAGQMIQCANLMLGLDETAGLTTTGVYP